MALITKVTGNDATGYTATYDDGHTEHFSFEPVFICEGISEKVAKPRKEHDYSYRPQAGEYKDCTKIFELADKFKACNGNVDARYAILNENGFSAEASIALEIIYLLEKATTEEKTYFLHWHKVSDLKPEVQAFLKKAPRGKDNLIGAILGITEKYEAYLSGNQEQAVIEPETTATPSETKEKKHMRKYTKEQAVMEISRAPKSYNTRRAVFQRITSSLMKCTKAQMTKAQMNEVFQAIMGKRAWLCGKTCTKDIMALSYAERITEWYVSLATKEASNDVMAEYEVYSDYAGDNSHPEEDIPVAVEPETPGSKPVDETLEWLNQELERVTRKFEGVRDSLETARGKYYAVKTATTSPELQKYLAQAAFELRRPYQLAIVSYRIARKELREVQARMAEYTGGNIAPAAEIVVFTENESYKAKTPEGKTLAFTVRKKYPGQRICVKEFAGSQEGIYQVSIENGVERVALGENGEILLSADRLLFTGEKVRTTNSPEAEYPQKAITVYFPARKEKITITPNANEKPVITAFSKEDELYLQGGMSLNFWMKCTAITREITHIPNKIYRGCIPPI